MKYYRFSRRRKNYLFGLSDYYKSQKKSVYMTNTDRSKMLDCGFYENQVWGALHKAWKGYTIAKNRGEDDKLIHYAEIIQELQDDLGRLVTSFPEIGKSALAFHSLRAAQIVEKNKSNSEYNHKQEQVSEEENYRGDRQYEEERSSKMMRIKLIGLLMSITKILQINQICFSFSLEPTSNNLTFYSLL